MRWRDALFAHWRVDPGTVEARLPDPLSVATHEGDAYLGVVPFEMTDIRPRGAPFGLSFPELNLRTYVTDGDTKGVYFFNLDAADTISVVVARALFQLPYYRAAMDVTRDGDRVTAVATRRRYRDRGVGTALVSAALDDCGRLVAEFGPDVRPFYESLEFEIETAESGRLRGQLQ